MIFGKKMENEGVIMMNCGIYEKMKKLNDHVLKDTMFLVIKNGIN
jgi:hypothetical protein